MSSDEAREQAGNGSGRLQIADLLVDTGTQQVFRHGVEIPLPRLSYDLLMALARAAPNTVSQDELMQQVWSGLVVSPETVTQRVKLLRNALGDDSQSPRYVGLVRGRGYRLLAAAEPELPAAFSPPSARTKSPPERPPHRGLMAVIGAGLLITLGWFLLQHLSPSPAPVSEAPRALSIAVLPFDPLSPEAQDHDYFSAGMHDDLLTHLSQIDGLRVISRASMLTFQAGEKRVGDIGAELGVSHVLEGSVQQVGSRVRVNVQLIDAEQDAHLWAKMYDREFSPAEVLDIQDDISRSVAESLQLTLLADSMSGLGSTGNARAYGLYLTGNGYRQRAYDDYASAEFRDLLLVAEDHYRRAVAIDPDFALAHAALSRVLAEIYWQEARPGAEQAAAAIEEAQRAARRALELVPDLPEGHLGLAYYHYYGQRDYRQALEEIRYAEAHMPADPSILTLKMYVFRRLGQLDAFVETARLGREVAPRDPMFVRLHAWGLRKQGRLDEAEDAYAVMARSRTNAAEAALGTALVRYLRDGDLQALASRALETAEGYPETAWYLSWVAGDLEAGREILQRTAHIVLDDSPPLAYKAGLLEVTAGNFARAEAYLEQARAELLGRLEQGGQPYPEKYLRHLALTLAALGLKDEAIEAGRAAVAGVSIESDGLMGPMYLADLALVYASSGETELALDALERALAQPFNPQPWSWQHDPRLASLRGEPRFVELVQRYGAPYRAPENRVAVAAED